jgi:hypothetical protein
MKILHLKGNQVQPLENPEIFSGCINLEEIDLSENNVIDFSAIHLTTIRETLKTLKINNNKDIEYENIKLSSLL